MVGPIIRYDDFGKKGPNPQKLLTIYEMDLGVNHVGLRPIGFQWNGLMC